MSKDTFINRKKLQQVENWFLCCNVKKNCKTWKVIPKLQYHKIHFLKCQTISNYVIRTLFLAISKRQERLEISPEGFSLLKIKTERPHYIQRLQLRKLSTLWTLRKKNFLSYNPSYEINHSSDGHKSHNKGHLQREVLQRCLAKRLNRIPKKGIQNQRQTKDNWIPEVNVD